MSSTSGSPAAVPNTSSPISFRASLPIQKLKDRRSYLRDAANEALQRVFKKNLSVFQVDGSESRGGLSSVASTYSKYTHDESRLTEYDRRTRRTTFPYVSRPIGQSRVSSNDATSPAKTARSAQRSQFSPLSRHSTYARGV